MPVKPTEERRLHSVAEESPVAESGSGPDQATPKRPARGSKARAATGKTPPAGKRSPASKQQSADTRGSAGGHQPKAVQRSTRAEMVEPPLPTLPKSEVEAAEVIENGEPVAVPSLRSVVGSVVATFGQARPLAREAVGFTGEVARIVRGTSTVAPARGDRRFTDPTWTENPLFRRLGQAYLALGQSITHLVDDLEAGGADWHKAEKARFAANILTSALAPTNNPLTNPAAIKRAFETGGASLGRGLGNLLDDIKHNGGMPSQTDRSAFKVGVDLACTPGSVVDIDDVAEVIQYTPSTPDVYARPLVIVPPPIGRYYFLDLRPTRSFVEFAVSRGIQVYMVSWRNPKRAQGGWDMDTYAERILSAIDTARDVTGSEDVNLLGFCAGGILSTTVLNHLAATGDSRVHSASFGVTLLDFDSPAPLGAFSAPRMLELAESNSKKDGVITGRALGKVFAWMRPDDLVFNYWVSNYLLGQDPPVFDILAWNADSTNLPAALHAQFLDIFKNNTMCQPGALNVLGTPVDLSQITVPTFVTGAITDHLTPWTGCYRTTQLFSGPSTFVLSNAGHIASLVNPPGNPKASYFTGPNPDPIPDPEVWQAAATRHSGTWWTAWADWIIERSGEQKPAPSALGSDAHPAGEPAPGSYILDGKRA